MAGRGSQAACRSPLGVDYDIDLTFSTVLARLSYKFGNFGKGPVVTRY